MNFPTNVPMPTPEYATIDLAMRTLSQGHPAAANFLAATVDVPSNKSVDGARLTLQFQNDEGDVGPEIILEWPSRVLSPRDSAVVALAHAALALDRQVAPGTSSRACLDGVVRERFFRELV